MRKYTGVVFSAAGILQASTQVQVVFSGSGLLANLFDDNNQPIGNPLVSDQNGRFAFRVFSGVYDFLDINNNPLETAVQIFDFTNPSEWIGVWNFPLSGVTFGSGGILDLYGSQTDQMAFDSGLRVGGAQGTTTPTLTLYGVPGSTADFISVFDLVGDQFKLFSVDANGVLHWGPGGAIVQDTNLYRVGTGVLKTDSSLQVGQSFAHQGSSIGFFGATPRSQPLVTGTITDPIMQQVVAALQSMGLITTTITVTASGAAVMSMSGSIIQTEPAVSSMTALGAATITATGTVNIAGKASASMTAKAIPSIF